jgi:uncharacterized protein (TIGR02246 family)
MTDEEGIRRTIALYAKHNDDQNPDGFVSLFTEDGRFLSKRAGHIEGRAALREFVIGTFADKGPNGRAKHVFANPVIDIDGDTAKAEVDCVEYRRTDPHSAWTIHHIVRYLPSLVKQGDRWLFSVIDYESPE